MKHRLCFLMGLAAWLNGGMAMFSGQIETILQLIACIALIASGAWMMARAYDELLEEKRNR